MREYLKYWKHQLFDSLYYSLADKEVNMERFFYDRDLRLCYNDTQPDGIHLEELAKSYPNTRLLIVGNCRALLSPKSGQLMEWTGEVFKKWKARAILNPIPCATVLVHLELQHPKDWDIQP